LEQITTHKNAPDRFANFMSPGPAESLPGPVVMNGNETCHVSCSRWW